MEYCPETLETRIHGNSKNLKATGIKSPMLLEEEREEGNISSLSTTPFVPSEGTDDSSLEFDWESVIDIIHDINGGLVYLHNHGTVHRDLKPKNGTRFIRAILLTFYSSLFGARSTMEAS